MESRVRVLLTLAGFEGLVAQHVVEVGTGTRRIDLAFPQWRVAIEYEGFHHFASEAQKQADFRR